MSESISLSRHRNLRVFGEPAVLQHVEFISIHQSDLLGLMLRGRLGWIFNDIQFHVVFMRNVFLREHCRESGGTK